VLQFHAVGEELVQGRVEQAHHHRQPVHGFEQAFEVGHLLAFQTVEGVLALVLVVGEDDALDDLEPFTHEHVLGPGETDAFGSELAGGGGIGGGVGVGAYTQRSDLIGPLQQGGELGGLLRLDQRNVAYVDAAVGAVDGDLVSLADVYVSDQCPAADTSMMRPLAPVTAGLPMPRATTAAWEVLPPWAVRMPSAAAMPWMSSGVVSGRTRITGPPSAAISTARSASKATRPEAAPGEAATPVVTASTSATFVDAETVELLDGGGVDPHDRLVAVDQALVDHLHRQPHRRLGGALAHPGLEDEELALLDGELDVAHVPVVALEPSMISISCRWGWGWRSASSSRVRVLRVPATTSSPWA
jgi:hypothetical protein